MKKIISLVSARPNFIKIAPLHKAFRVLNGAKPSGKVPELWDGKMAEKIVNIISENI